MAAVAKPLILSLDEYLQTSYRPDCDYLDAEVKERNLGEFKHSAVQTAFAAWFLSHARE